MTSDQHSASSTLVRLDGELTIYRAAEVCGTLRAALANPIDLQIDLSAVSEIDSAGVQLLLSAQKTASLAGRSVFLVAPSESVKEVFALFGLSELAISHIEADSDEVAPPIEEIV